MEAVSNPPERSSVSSMLREAGVRLTEEPDNASAALRTLRNRLASITAEPLDSSVVATRARTVGFLSDLIVADCQFNLLGDIPWSPVSGPAFEKRLRAFFEGLGRHLVDLADSVDSERPLGIIDATGGVIDDYIRLVNWCNTLDPTSDPIGHD